MTRTFKMELSERQAEALAQLVKRFGFDDARRLSSAHDGGRERDDMLEAVCILSRSLAAEGFKPR